MRPVAVVTGASSGIGAAFARELARRGHDLWITARRHDRLEELASEIREASGARVDVLALDLANAEGPRALLDRLSVERVVPDLFVNNAGFGYMGEALDLDHATSLEMIQLNISALTELTLGIARRMVAIGRGGIINVASTAAFQPTPFTAVYGATKAFVLSFSESLNEELSGRGVRVHTLCPGFTESEFHSRAGSPGGVPRWMGTTPEECVRRDLDAYARGEAVYIDGAINWLGALTQRLVPRRLVVRMSGRLMKPRSPR